MAAQSLFSAIVYSSIATVSAAGLAAGTHLKNAHLREAADEAKLELTGAASQGAVLAGEIGGGAADERQFARPTFSRIVIEHTGISRLEGRGAPGSQVFISAADAVIAAATVNADGRWVVTLAKELPPGEHRLGTRSESATRSVTGEEVRVFVPSDMRRTSVVAYEAAPAAGADERVGLRDRAERLATEASERFGEILEGESAGGGTRVAQLEEKPGSAGGVSQSSGFSAVLEWLRNAAGTYRDVVTDELSDGEKDARAAKSEEPAEASETAPGGDASGSAEGLSVGGVIESVRSWLDEAGQTFEEEVAQPLSVGEPSGQIGADESIVAREEAADRELHFSEKDIAAAEKARLEAARRYTEERRRAEEAWHAAEERAAEAANSEEARRRLEETRRREAEEAERLELEIKRAAEAAARRTAETERKIENGLRRLDEARRLEEERRFAEAQKAAEAARRDYMARRLAAEAEVEEEARQRAAAEEARRAAEVEAAALARQREDERRAAAAAAAEQAERDRLARIAEAEATAAAARETKERERQKAEADAKRNAAEDAADAAQEEEEYRILRRMLAEAKRAEEAAKRLFKPAPPERALEDEAREAEVAEAPVAERKEAESEDAPVAEAKTTEVEVAEAKPRPRKSPTRVGGWKKSKKSVRTASKSKKHARTASKCSKKKKCRTARTRRAGYHLVQSRDTLWGLARRYYGRGDRYPRIFHANRSRLRDPDVLRPCQWLRIPGNWRRRS